VDGVLGKIVRAILGEGALGVVEVDGGGRGGAACGELMKDGGGAGEAGFFGECHAVESDGTDLGDDGCGGGVESLDVDDDGCG